MFHLRAFECLGACDLAPMASIEGHYRGPLTPGGRVTIAEHLRDGGSPADVLPDKADCRGCGGGERDDGILLQHADVPDLNRIDTYERLGGYAALRRALTEMTADQVVQGARGHRACAAAAARASRWARRRASCPTATSRSTCAATRTSPSPAPSRTAS